MSITTEVKKPPEIDYLVFCETVRRAQKHIQNKRKLMYADLVNVLCVDLRTKERKDILRWCTYMIKQGKVYLELP